LSSLSHLGGLDASTALVYRRAMDTLDAAGIEFLVGGAYAFARYTGIHRHTKDFDIFLREGDCDRAIDALEANGYRGEVTFTHWLAKAWHDDLFVDLIYGSGNGLTRVDEGWFTHAVRGEVIGRPCLLIPAEEMIWSKAFIMERERYDGADIAHVIRARSAQLDWDRMLARFGHHWRVLYVHLILHGFIWPGERSAVPRRVVEELSRRLLEEAGTDAEDRGLCQGTLLSRAQYLLDVGSWGYVDAREVPVGTMTPEQITHWTAGIAIDGEK
jgi:hypothetical protein